MSPLRSAPCWAAAIAAGAAADALGAPLAWILGPLLASAAFSIAGAQPWAPVAARRFGQLIVGSAIGLSMTPQAAWNLLLWAPALAATAVVSILCGAAFSVALARFGRVDATTAYFAMLPGGLSEMAAVGAAHGARAEAVSLAQALRVTLAVMLLPPIVLAIGEDGGIGLAGRAEIGFGVVAALVGAGVLGALALRRLRLANPWMLGALVSTAILAGAGVVEGRVPPPALWAGQLLIGMSIGSRFRRDIVRSLPRLAAVHAALALALGATMFGFAAGLSRLFGIDLASAVLGASPGGFAEMTLTAEALHLDVALVAGFHFCRAFIVNGFAPQFRTWLERVGWFAFFRRLVGGP